MTQVFFWLVVLALTAGAASLWVRADIDLIDRDQEDPDA